MMKPVDRLMNQALDEKVFPGAVLLVSQNGLIRYNQAFGLANIFEGRPVTIETVFDLASLTKPLATSLAVMQLIKTQRLHLDQTVGTILPALNTPAKASIQIAHLLSHTSGYPDYRPFFQTLSELPQGDRKPELRRRLAAEPLQSEPGSEVRYSDLGFMILEWIVETIAGQRLDDFVTQSIYKPLAIEPLYFIDLRSPRPHAAYAATEDCPWRHVLLEGVVHDENTFAIGGVSGQSGLFGNAQAIHALLMALVDAYQDVSDDSIFSSELVRRFFTRYDNKPMALGFDVPAETDSSAGRLFSSNSIGHLGFTGTSFWVDLDQMVITILLTNRVHPSRENDSIKSFRPLLHDTVMQAL